ncbi:hypothetical protein H5P28_17950 [Ruficoccus amylovorans]|uniref:Prepilin-type N-terminal cleavage/methylation domain-containing protein n=1 Tax=Ruficoccus amylovorans TaxID=1804625 RepID=A0A842HHE3_9BACT|nr:hypothetical protein [Ruficoccus amylovorans]MBC2596155.1 hypothetical protein [Ruficoccus amylovorans]
MKVHRFRAGMSFLEVLLAVAMLGLLIVAGATMLFALTRSYFTLETSPLFDRHADGVIGLLRSLASESGPPPDPNSNARPGPQFGWSTSPVSQKSTLSFKIDRDLAFFVSDEHPLPAIDAFLEFDEENHQFWLAWYVDPKFTNNNRTINYTLLSPWASDIQYGYYDEGQNQWEFEFASDDSRQHGNEKPRNVTLIFDRDDVVVRRTIYLDTPTHHVLDY